MPDDIETFSKLMSIDVDEVRLAAKNKSIRCECGNFKKVRKSTQSAVGWYFFNLCDDPKCNPRYGKKRPEHSLIMKELAKSGKSSKFSNTLIKPGEMFNINLNSDKFKETVLRNMGIEVVDLESQFSSVLSERNTNVELRRRQILARYNKWETAYKILIEMVCGRIPTNDWVMGLQDEEIRSLWKKIHGINTIRNNDKSMSTGRCSFFKGELLLDLKFNNQGLTAINTRSGWETSMVRLLEKGGYKWSYESMRFQTIDKSSFYIPDFIVEIGNDTYMIEVKGSYYRQDKEWYIKNKIGAGIEYCKSMGWHYCLITKEPKTLNFTDKEMLC